MKRRSWILAALMAIGFHGAAHGDELPDYIRFQDDARSSRLESAIRTMTLPSGQRVDLIGAVHIADDAYYQQLNQRFDAYDSVLFELVGDPKSVTEPVPGAGSDSAVSFIQQAAGQYLGLRFQLDGIDYTRKNMVHADATADEFERMQKERGETVLTLFGRAMQVQMAAEMSGRADPATRGLDTFELIRILMSRDAALQFKKVLAKMLAQTESMTAAMESTEASAILSGRNEVVGRRIKEVLADRKQRRIAVFYGCAHMAGIEAALVRDMKAKVSAEEWLAAWTMLKVADAAASGASPFARK
jgi:hypothetical protein